VWSSSDLANSNRGLDGKGEDESLLMTVHRYRLPGCCRAVRATRVAMLQCEHSRGMLGLNACTHSASRRVFG
jgi:hypothetical protein